MTDTTGRIVLRGLFLAGIAFAVLPFGSVSRFAFAFSSFLLCLAWLLTVVRFTARGTDIPEPVLGVVRHSMLVAIAITALAILQIIPISSNSLVVPALAGKTELAQGLSLSPSATLASIPHFITPIAVFGTACLLHPDDRSAVAFLRALALFGGVICIFGLMQFTLAPDRLLFWEKLHYKDSLTTVFVNRNTAATFCGLTLVLSLGLFFHELKSSRWGAGGLLRALDHGLPLVPTLLAITAGASFLSLLLTKSRAGAVSSVFVALLLLLAYWLKRTPAAARWSRRNLISGMGILLSSMVVIYLFAGRTLARLEVSGIESARWCSYKSALQAVKDHWLFGTGLGSFFDVFPMYKDIECGIFGEWEYLHNVYLEAALSGGIVLVAIMVYAIGILSLYLVRGLRTRQKYQFIPWLGMLALLLVALHSILDFSIQINGIAVFAAAILGAVMSVATGRSSRSSNTDATMRVEINRDRGPTTMPDPV